MTTARRLGLDPSAIAENYDTFKKKHVSQNREIIHKNSELMKSNAALNARVRELQTSLMSLKTENLRLSAQNFNLESQLAQARSNNNPLSTRSLSRIRSALQDAFRGLHEVQDILTDVPPEEEQEDYNTNNEADIGKGQPNTPRPSLSSARRGERRFTLSVPPNLSLIAESDADNDNPDSDLESQPLVPPPTYFHHHPSSSPLNSPTPSSSSSSSSQADPSVVSIRASRRVSGLFPSDLPLPPDPLLSSSSQRLPPPTTSHPEAILLPAPAPTPISKVRSSPRKAGRPSKRKSTHTSADEFNHNAASLIEPARKKRPKSRNNTASSSKILPSAAQNASYENDIGKLDKNNQLLDNDSSVFATTTPEDEKNRDGNNNCSPVLGEKTNLTGTTLSEQQIEKCQNNNNSNTPSTANKGNTEGLTGNTMKKKPRAAEELDTLVEEMSSFSEQQQQQQQQNEDVGTFGKSRRPRKVVNYTLPSLNSKMRQSDAYMAESAKTVKPNRRSSTHSHTKTISLQPQLPIPPSSPPPRLSTGSSASSTSNSSDVLPQPPSLPPSTAKSKKVSQLLPPISSPPSYL